MGSHVVAEEEYDFINYDKASNENTNFYRVVYTSVSQTVLSAIPPGGTSSYRGFKDADIRIDVTDGEGLITMGKFGSAPRTTRVDKSHEGHVDAGEFYSIQNIHNDRWLKMVLHFSKPFFAKGAVYPIDPAPAATQESPYVLSPVPVRASIQSVPIQAVSSAPVPVVTTTSVPVHTTTSIPVQTVTIPPPVAPNRGPVMFEPVSGGMVQPAPQAVYYQSAPTVIQTPPTQTIVTRTYVPARVPSYPTAPPGSVPALPTVKPLI